MEELFEDLVGFLMHEEVQTDNAAEILAGEGNDDHMMPTGTISSFSNVIDDHELEADWYNQYSELHFPDPHQFGEEVMYDNQQSNDIRFDNLLLDVNGYFQENGFLTDQYIHDATLTGPLQQQADINCHINDIDIVNDDQPLNNHPRSSTPEQLDRRQEPQERGSKLLEHVGEPNAKRPKRRKKDKQVQPVNHGEVEDVEEINSDNTNAGEDDDYEENIGDDNQSSSVISKNLVSERNRRKRLNNQLFTLRGLVPCITKMDKRSVLVDALAYLQDILNQTQKEIEAGTTEDPGQPIIDSAMSPDSFTANVEIHHPPCHHHLGVVVEKSVISADVEGQPQPIMSTVLEPKTTPYSAIFPAITKMEAEKVDEERYMLKIVYNKALGAMSQVQRSVEMLKGVEFINVSVSEYDQQHMQSSSFLRVKKIKGSLSVTDEENLLERVKVMAKQLGLNLPCDPSSADN